MMNFRKGNFKNDLILGQNMEILAIKKMCCNNNELKLLSTNNDYRFDFILSNNKKYEVKFDRKAYETNNIYIETMAHGKSSGIDKTEADYYIIVVPKFKTDVLLEFNFNFYLIEVSKLKELIEKQQYKKYLKYCINAGYIFDIEIIIINSLIL